MTKQGVGAEIGVHKGDFSASILQIAKPKRLYLIDPWKCFDTAQHKASLFGSDNVTQADMDARFKDVEKRFEKAAAVKIVRELSGDAAGKLRDKELDFVYIDGDHNYEGVRADLENFYPKVKLGGQIFLDDYSLTGWWRDGVVRATHEFLAKYPCRIAFVMDNQVCIQKL
ncbi:MAG: class I SAM-dependent methyltransferase [Pseudorhodobacter sp.]